MLAILNNDHEVCNRCTSCCCYTCEGGSGPRAPMSCCDVVRIAAHSGKNAREFAQLADRPARESLADIWDQVPSLGALYERGHFIHLKYENGACVLLDEQGRCRLPRDVRPRYCAFYPLWFTFDPLTRDISLKIVGSSACRAVVESSAEAETVLKMFRYHRDEMLALAQRTRSEIQEHRMLSDKALATLVGGPRRRVLQRTAASPPTARRPVRS